MVNRRQQFLWYISLVVVLSACSSTGGRNIEPEDVERPEEVINMADYEDFDPEPYRESEPGRGEDIVHDVPEELLGGEVASSGIERTIQGYRIQIFSSADKDAADREVEKAITWWRDAYGQGTLQEAYPGDASSPAVELVYLQPYFRIRLGNFASREEAQQTLALVRRQFAGAFLVPDTVTVQR